MEHKETSTDSAELAFFQEFYNKYKNLIYLTSQQYTDDPEELEDLMQDVILRLMHYIPSLMDIEDSYTQTVSYLWQTIRSVYIDRQRASGTGPAEFPVEMLDVFYKKRVNQSEPLEQAAALLDAQTLQKCLSQQEWDLLYKKYILGYSYEELSREYDRSPNSIRMTLSRARKHARKILKKGEDNHDRTK